MKRTLYDRLYGRVALGPGCWEWQGAKTSEGYGHLSVNGRTIKAHRFSWELAYGPIPAEMQVCHHCDNRLCVKPPHLFLGTNADNMADAIRKGRGVPIVVGFNRGANHGRTHLTDSDVLEIRRLSPSVSQRKLAARFGISKTEVGSLVRRERWTHI